MKEGWSYNWCQHNRSKQENPVTGEIGWRRCSNMRSTGSLCGIDAKLFKKENVFYGYLQRLFPF